MTVDVDYLIVGAGATGMAFADTMLTESEATMAIVDRHDRPGGHWTHAYPFVRLHQPAATYGVESRPLGSGAKDEAGLNKGFYDLASGAEVLSHFDLVMRERFLPSGRVQYLPMSEVADSGDVVSLLSGRRTEVRAGKLVDATYSRVAVPSTHTPTFAVDPEVAFVPVNDLPRRAPEFRRYVVIGAGKTGMDACLWLLANGAEPDCIRWIMPRDSWLLNRANYQPGDEFLERAAKGLADQVEALAGAESVDDLFLRLEAADEVRRIDPLVTPTAYHCAIVSDAELDELRRIRDIVRLGRVTRIEAERIVLAGGEVPTSGDCLHVDCSAVGIPTRPTRPVFEGDRITLQFVRLCQPVFSAALIARVEAVLDDDGEKNRLCAPIAPLSVPSHWPERMVVELANRRRWSTTPEVAEWLVRSRLDGFAKRVRSLTGTETATLAHLQRYAAHAGAASENARRLTA
ncbi:MAG TPA: NAD(P)-binding protein [Acidimicrobiales bacterium]|nr:NAD(P)-binding protein [Acidimicrobiales bacterium]